MIGGSIKSRVAVTFLTNLIRAALMFIGGLLIARGLQPDKFGDYNFLLASMGGVLGFLDMGTGNAFYTFISQRPRSRAYIFSYIFWQIFQIAVPVFIIIFILPEQWFEKIWLGQTKNLIILSFVSLFLKQQAWLTILQVGESQRLTYRVQVLAFLSALLFFGLVFVAWFFEKMTIQLVYQIIIIDYLIILIISYKYIVLNLKFSEEKFHFKTVLNEYIKYCAPLFFYTVVGVFLTFADSWLLQKFGGTKQQAYYGVAFQFASIGLIASLAFFQIIWKEIAEAYERNDRERIKKLYQKSSRFLLTLVAIPCAFMMPWSSDILTITTGSAYENGSLILTLMFLYPVHQSLSYIVCAMLYATNRVKVQVAFGMAYMIVGLIASYFLQASKTALIPGFGMGGLGMALKMVVLNFIYTNGMVWWIAKENNWKFDWLYQVVGVSGLIVISYTVQEVLFHIPVVMQWPILAYLSVAFTIYMILCLIFIYSSPGLAGLTRLEIKQNLLKMLNIGKGRSISK